MHHPTSSLHNKFCSPCRPSCCQSAYIPTYNTVNGTRVYFPNPPGFMLELEVDKEVIQRVPDENVFSLGRMIDGFRKMERKGTLNPKVKELLSQNGMIWSRSETTSMPPSVSINDIDYPLHVSEGTVVTPFPLVCLTIIVTNTLFFSTSLSFLSLALLRLLDPLLLILFTVLLLFT